jgi:hypothetical protein
VKNRRAKRLSRRGGAFARGVVLRKSQAAMGPAGSGDAGKRDMWRQRRDERSVSEVRSASFQSGFAYASHESTHAYQALWPGSRCDVGFPRPEQTKPRRCQASRVAGCTTWSAARQPCHRCDSPSHRTRRLQRPTGGEARRSPDAVPRVKDQPPERVEERNDDGLDGSSLFRATHNLNRHNAHRVFGGTGERRWSQRQCGHTQVRYSYGRQ